MRHTTDEKGASNWEFRATYSKEIQKLIVVMPDPENLPK
jgi:hypothetical protein